MNWTHLVALCALFAAGVGLVVLGLGVAATITLLKAVAPIFGLAFMSLAVGFAVGGYLNW